MPCTDKSFRSSVSPSSRVWRSPMRGRLRRFRENRSLHANEARHHLADLQDPALHYSTCSPNCVRAREAGRRRRRYSGSPRTTSTNGLGSSLLATRRIFLDRLGWPGPGHAAAEAWTTLGSRDQPACRFWPPRSNPLRTVLRSVGPQQLHMRAYQTPQVLGHEEPQVRGHSYQCWTGWCGWVARQRRSGRGQTRSVWRPHSVLSVPAHRPDRGSAPAATGKVQGRHPTEG